MWTIKRTIVAGILAIAVLFSGSAAWTAFAQAEDQGSVATLWSRVAQKLGIEEQKVQDAFKEAREEMREEALNRYLEWAVEQNKITQEEANEYRDWWQSRPECSELNEWRQSRPDVPLLRRPFDNGFRGGMYLTPNRAGVRLGKA